MPGAGIGARIAIILGVVGVAAAGVYVASAAAKPAAPKASGVNFVLQWAAGSPTVVSGNVVVPAGQALSLVPNSVNATIISVSGPNGSIFSATTAASEPASYTIPAGQVPAGTYTITWDPDKTTPGTQLITTTLTVTSS